MDKQQPCYYYDHPRSEMLEFIPDNAKFILEVGCGAVYLEVWSSPKEPEYWGVEISEDAAKNAQSHLDKVFTGDVAISLIIFR